MHAIDIRCPQPPPKEAHAKLPVPSQASSTRSQPSIIRRHCDPVESLPRPPPSENWSLGGTCLSSPAATSPTSAQLLDAQKRIRRGSPSRRCDLTAPRAGCAHAPCNACLSTRLGSPLPITIRERCLAAAPLPSLLQLLETPNPRAAPDQPISGRRLLRVEGSVPSASSSLSLMPSLSHLAVCLIGMHCFAIPTSSSSRLLALRGGMQIESCRALGRTGVYSAALFVMTISLLLSLSFCTLLTSTPQSLLAISASRSLPLALCLSISPSRSLPLPPVPYERKEDHCYHRYTCQLRRLFHQVLYKTP